MLHLVPVSDPDTEPRGEYVDSSRRGFDPRLRPYRVAVYVAYGVIVLWLCLGMIVSVVRALWP